MLLKIEIEATILESTSIAQHSQPNIKLQKSKRGATRKYDFYPIARKQRYPASWTFPNLTHTFDLFGDIISGCCLLRASYRALSLTSLSEAGCRAALLT